MTRDLTRYAVRMVATGEVLDVGLNKPEADIYVSSFNAIRCGEGQQAEKVEIDWKIRTPHPIS